MLTILSNFRGYIEAGIAAILIGLLVTCYVDLKANEHSLAKANESIAAYKVQLQALNTSLSVQNQAVESLKLQSEQNQRLAQELLKKTQQKTKETYKQADKIANAKGSTCEDAKNLILNNIQ